MIFSLRRFASVFLVDYPKKLAYVWQSSEYSVTPTLRWWLRIGDFRTFAKRGELVLTGPARLVRATIVFCAGLYAILNVLSIFHLYSTFTFRALHALTAVLLYPTVVVIMSIVPVLLLRLLKLPFDKRTIFRARGIFHNHPGTIIAVAGSYGKTSMKELLIATLGSEKKVTSTPGNRNTLLSQSTFAKSLNGDEDFVIVELGEGQPGDIAKMVRLIDPDYAVVTGLAPNHLDHYGTLEAVAKDFEVLASYVGPEKTFLNADSPELFRLLGQKGMNYSSDGFDGWVPIKVSVAVDDLKFEVEKCGESFRLASSFVGGHNVGPMLFAVVLAQMLGVDRNRSIKKLETLQPYKHRMQPRKLNGAWLIDDTYNGNIEGMLAGLEYLEEIKVQGRKLYATPGLVDQGIETENVHTRLGEAIAQCNPDQVYLMRNGVMPIIKSAMEAKGFAGKVTVVDDPLSFYVNMQDVLASGDVMLCQNDLPDQYQS
jgi:UDP-N-acetylmuramoyl-tripeptide--D-alanyl-D-alanine ligase